MHRFKNPILHLLGSRVTGHFAAIKWGRDSRNVEACALRHMCETGGPRFASGQLQPACERILDKKFVTARRYEGQINFPSVAALPTKGYLRAFLRRLE